MRPHAKAGRRKPLVRMSREQLLAEIAWLRKRVRNLTIDCEALGSDNARLLVALREADTARGALNRALIGLQVQGIE